MGLRILLRLTCLKQYLLSLGLVYISLLCSHYYIDECERVEVERRFSLAKRKCNLGMITAKLTDTAFHCIAMSIVVLNLRKLVLSLTAFLKQHFLYFGFFLSFLLFSRH